jgi:hypothetical protein
VFSDWSDSGSLCQSPVVDSCKQSAETLSVSGQDVGTTGVEKFHDLQVSSLASV